MDYRDLGKTGFKVSVIGIGVEYLKNTSTEEISQIFRSALKQGINYFDLVWSFPNIIDGLKDALKKESTKPIISFHLGSCVSNGKYKRTRKPVECEKTFEICLKVWTTILRR